MHDRQDPLGGKGFLQLGGKKRACHWVKVVNGGSTQGATSKKLNTTSIIGIANRPAQMTWKKKTGLNNELTKGGHGEKLFW